MPQTMDNEMAEMPEKDFRALLSKKKINNHIKNSNKQTNTVRKSIQNLGQKDTTVGEMISNLEEIFKKHEEKTSEKKLKF